MNRRMCFARACHEYRAIASSRAGKLGGRPRRPTVDEARATKLEELVPKALVLEANLDAESEQVRQRAADSILDRVGGRPIQAIRTEESDMDELFASLSLEAERITLRAVAVELEQPRG